jgi:hypothetical protein
MRTLCDFRPMGIHWSYRCLVSVDKVQILVILQISSSRNCLPADEFALQTVLHFVNRR